MTCHRICIMIGKVDATSGAGTAHSSETLEFISALGGLSCCLICLFICHCVLCLVLWFRLALQFPHKAMFGFSFYSHLFWRWLFMIFLIIHVYWCSIRFPYKKTLVSFNSNTHVTSEAGTLPFVPVVWWGSCWSVFILLFFCVVFCRLLFVFFVIFLLVIALSILWVMTSDYSLVPSIFSYKTHKLVKSIHRGANNCIVNISIMCSDTAIHWWPTNFWQRSYYLRDC